MTARSGHELGRSDAELSSAMAAGDLTALGIVYERHAALAYGLALRIAANAASAEAIVESAFLRIWREPNDRGRRGSVRSRVITLVTREALARVGRPALVPEHGTAEEQSCQSVTGGWRVDAASGV